MTDDFGTAVRKIHAREFGKFLLGQAIGITLLLALVALIASAMGEA